MTDNQESNGNVRNTLVSELPRIDAALKSYCSWTAAAKDGMTIKEALGMTRKLSIAINQHVFSVAAKPSNDYMVCSKLWNEIVTAKQKPTKWLGKTALRLAWNDLEVGLNNAENGSKRLENSDEAFVEFFKGFEKILFADDDHTASLIWNSEAELTRRATERKERASQRLQEEKSTIERISGPIIEEINECGE